MLEGRVKGWVRAARTKMAAAIAVAARAWVEVVKVIEVVEKGWVEVARA